VTDPPPIVRESLLTAAVHGAPVERVEVARIELAPGQATGLHLHPCPVVGYVAFYLLPPGERRLIEMLD
jgi:hypothetical protein